MTSPEDLIHFVLRERGAREEEGRLVELLSLQALVDRGDAVAGLVPEDVIPGGVRMVCDSNLSRIRDGDRVLLQSETDRFGATLTAMADHGRCLELQTERAAKGIGPGPWTARPQSIDLSGPIIEALRRLQPGAPGWLLFGGVEVVAPLYMWDR